MKIGIFTKTEMCGGSEMRFVELANAIVTYTNHSAYLFSEKNMPHGIESCAKPGVNICKNTILPAGEHIELLYEMDVLLIINTDSKSFTTIDYFEGKSEKHGFFIDLTKMTQMIFLFNFLVSPSRHLATLEPKCGNIKIICTNRKFFEEITSQDRYEHVRHFPRIILESPIDPDKYDTKKNPSNRIRFGMHSKGMSNKWNEDWPKLIQKCNDRLGDQVAFDFMGMNRQLRPKVEGLGNTIVRSENEISVREYLNGIDIFTFFPSWKRDEPWARTVAEAMTTGCPIIATDKGGNKDQVLHGNNGYLCKDLDGFFRYIVQLASNRRQIEKMSRNSLILAKNFTSEKVIRKFIEFIEV